MTVSNYVDPAISALLARRRQGLLPIFPYYDLGDAIVPLRGIRLCYARPRETIVGRAAKAAGVKAVRPRFLKQTTDFGFSRIYETVMRATPRRVAFSPRYRI